MREMKSEELEFVAGGIGLPAPFVGEQPVGSRGPFLPHHVPVPIPIPIDPPVGRTLI
jgi:hypothetical protein